MSKFRNEFAELLNNLRKDPKFIIKDLEEQMKYIDNKKVMRLPGSKCGIQLNEGAPAYTQAISNLQEIQPVGEVKPNPWLNAITKEYLAEIVKADDHDVEANKFDEILDKYGKYEGNLYTISEYGGDSPKQVLMNLLVQDGAEKKTNVINMTKTNFREIGVSFGAHKTYGYCTFILMVTKFKSVEDIQESKKLNEANIPEAKAQPNPYLEEPSNDTPTPSNPNTVLRAKKKDLPLEVDPDFTEGVVKVTKSEKIIEISGKKYLVITTVKFMEDGSKETEKIREPLDQ